MRLPEKSHFIKDGVDIADINQGHLANCWFLAALSSLAQKLPKDCPLKVKQVAIDRATQREANSTDEAKAAGVYRFKQGINRYNFYLVQYEKPLYIESQGKRKSTEGF